jgi:aminoglycoside phosphotransferase family enzyme/predicted kinase
MPLQFFPMSAVTFDSIVNLLSSPKSYAPAPGHVEVIETHISLVFIAGSFAYKLKRSVKFDFLDFTTLELREQACREEVRLNRRLASEVYLGVVAVTRLGDGSLQLGGKGDVVEWLVHMRRLPVERTLDHLVNHGQLQPEHLSELTKVLSDFYQTLSPLPITPLQYREHYTVHVQANLRELIAVSHHCPVDLIQATHGFQLQLLNLRPELFDVRVDGGYVIEGHGDLRPEHICFAEPIAIFDCIEFNLDFRRVDLADELAFLAMECDVLGAQWAGTQLFTALRGRTGNPPPVLIDFYKSYRACVRAKVAALRADQLEGETQTAATTQAVRYLQLANQYANQWNRPLVIVIGGLSGTGKSTLSQQLATTLGAELLQSDTVRMELFGKSQAPAEFAGGNYTPQRRQQVYAEMLRRASLFHQQDVSVVLDGTFSTAASIADAHSIVKDARGLFLAVECVCDPAIARQRILHRLAMSENASEMRPELTLAQSTSWEPWPAYIPQRRIDCAADPHVQVAKVLDELRRCYSLAKS